SGAHRHPQARVLPCYDRIYNRRKRFRQPFSELIIFRPTLGWRPLRRRSLVESSRKGRRCDGAATKGSCSCSSSCSCSNELGIAEQRQRMSISYLCFFVGADPFFLATQDSTAMGRR